MSVISYYPSSSLRSIASDHNFAIMRNNSLTDNPSNFFTHENISSEKNLRARKFIKYIEDTLNIKKQHPSFLKQLLESDLNNLNDEINNTIFKTQGYFKRLFSTESWFEWFEYRTKLGIVVQRFSDCLDNNVRIEKFIKFEREDLQAANSQAKKLLDKLTNSTNTQNFIAEREKENRIRKIFNSAIKSGWGFVKNVYSSIKLPDIFPIKGANAQAVCFRYVATAYPNCEGGGLWDFEVSDNFIFYIFRNASSSLRQGIIDASNPYNLVQFPVTNTPYLTRGNVVTFISSSDSILVMWGNNNDLNIYTLKCPPTTSSTSTTTSITSTSSTSSSSSTSTTSVSSVIPSLTLTETDINSTRSSSSQFENSQPTTSSSSTIKEKKSHDMIIGVFIGLGFGLLFTLPLYVYLFKKRKSDSDDSISLHPIGSTTRIDYNPTRADFPSDTSTMMEGNHDEIGEYRRTPVHVAPISGSGEYDPAEEYRKSTFGN